MSGLECSRLFEHSVLPILYYCTDIPSISTHTYHRSHNTPHISPTHITAHISHPHGSQLTFLFPYITLHITLRISLRIYHRSISDAHISVGHCSGELVGGVVAAAAVEASAGQPDHGADEQGHVDDAKGCIGWHLLVLRSLVSASHLCSRI